MVADIAPGSASSDPAELTAFRGALVFHRHRRLARTRAWRYDGVNPPAMVADLAALPLQSSNPGDLVDAAGTLFFHARAGAADPATSSGSTTVSIPR